ncbi:MAG: YkgJ family cysteine cluster protein [Planctomycetota bacterium]|nr:YkgJ family cysteine cluster protein [Planctomycetota bacterium]
MMRLLGHKPPWYAAGLAFECVQCGRCCAGPEEGYVWVTAEQIEAIARQLSIGADEMKRRYLRRVGRRWSLLEQPGSRDCIFLTDDNEGWRRCRIYDVRPAQCRTWPFWPANLAGPKAWASAGRRCKGINRGRLYSLEEIETRRDATRG